MAHSYTSCLYHCVFSTKERRNMIQPSLQEKLWPYLGGIARKNHIQAFAVGGIENHVHMLLQIPSTISITKAVQLIKGGSSKWIHESFSEHRLFAWQEGYGAFSIGVSQIKKTIQYINSQAEHHKIKTFEEEYIEFLQHHQIEFDPRFVWG